MLEVFVREGIKADREVASAIAKVTEAANRHGTGVLVSRIREGHYIIRAHPAVPYGFTREQVGG